MPKKMGAPGVSSRKEKIRKQTVEDGSSGLTQPADWTKLEVRGLVPKNAVKAIFSFVMTGAKKSTGKALFDKASLNISE